MADVDSSIWQSFVKVYNHYYFYDLNLLFISWNKDEISLNFQYSLEYFRQIQQFLSGSLILLIF